MKNNPTNKTAAKNKPLKKAKHARKRRIHQADKKRTEKPAVTFQHCSAKRLKFVRTVELTDKFAKILGRSVGKIIPLTIRNIENGVPLISIFRDVKNKNLILRCDRVKLFQALTHDADGNAKFEPYKP